MKIISRYSFSPYQIAIETEEEHRYIMGLLKLAPNCMKISADGFQRGIHEKFKEEFLNRFDGRSKKKKKEEKKNGY